MQYVSITKLTPVDPRPLQDRKLRALEKEARSLGIWGDICQGSRVVLAHTIDLEGETHCAMLLHGGFPLEIVPPYVGSQDLALVAEGVLKFSRSPLEAGVACMASLKLDAGGEERVGTPLKALEEWSVRAGVWLDREAEKERAREEREAARAQNEAEKAREWAARAERAREEREAEAERLRVAREEREAREARDREKEEKARREAIAAWEAEEAAKRAEEEARREAMEARRKARAEARAEEARLRFAMFWIELACVAELILERSRDPLRPLREQGGEVVEVAAEGWEVWEYPAGRYAEVEGSEAGEGGEAGEAGEGSGVAVHEFEADLPYILNVVRLHVCEDRRGWEDRRGFWVVTGDNLSLHLVTDLEIALAILRKEWRVREAQEFRGEGYCRKVRRQDGWDSRLERAVEALG